MHTVTQMIAHRFEMRKGSKSRALLFLGALCLASATLPLSGESCAPPPLVYPWCTSVIRPPQAGKKGKGTGATFPPAYSPPGLCPYTPPGPSSWPPFSTALLFPGHVLPRCVPAAGAETTISSPPPPQPLPPPQPPSPPPSPPRPPPPPRSKRTVL